MKNSVGVFFLSGMLAVCFTAVTAGATQQAPVVLGSASTFAILAGSTVSFTGAGTVTGNIGVSPGTAFVGGSPAVTVDGTVYAGDPVSAQAQIDLASAITDATGRQTPVTVSGDIGGLNLSPGLYKANTTLAISSSDLVLDGQGNPDAVFIFQIGSTFTMTSGRQVLLINGATASNVFWQVGTSATLGTGTVLHGTIMAAASITMETGATLDGRALAQNGAVTVDTGGGSSTIVPVAPLRFIPVTPCRVADTRKENAPFGGPLVGGGTSRDFIIPNSACSIPSTAQAYSISVAVVPVTQLGFLTVWPAGQPRPVAGTLNSSDGRIKATAAILGAGTGGAVSFYASNDTHVVVDIDGYFVPHSNSAGLAFYPLTPCRVADTRHQSAPYISGGQTRTFDVLSSSCSVPSAAQAYSFNFTAVPHGPLGFLTVWPTGSSKPGVSTLNAPTGTPTANAAITPAGSSGEINAFATNDTDLTIDINGYFAPPVSGGLSFYPLATCRALDTRLPSGSSPFSGILDVNLEGSSCNVPIAAQAYVLNVAVVTPPGPLGYLSMWALGEEQPTVSTLNAADGAITSNMAITGTTNGFTAVFASNPTFLILDISGYLAP